jgi:hypothetical protein
MNIEAFHQTCGEINWVINERGTRSLHNGRIRMKGAGVIYIQSWRKLIVGDRNRVAGGRTE